ncbi:cysteine hydrolase [Burkholderia sp. 22PA0106]|uniref:cysteine hydrolase n=1 Tax=Burkholderia sp. 22PA0106 TaxID=3237371 RepID=UPI0039C27CBF
MPISTLDPNTALIVVDLQRGIVGSASIESIAPIIERSRALLDAFRRHGLPVVLVNVDGAAPGRTERPRRTEALPPGWAELIPELDRQAGDVLVTKRTWGAFSGTDLDRQLKTRGVTQVVIVGVATGTGVESTARQAYELGYHVTLAVDAMTDGKPQAHDTSLNHVFPRLGETGTTQHVLDLLDARGIRHA